MADRDTTSASHAAPSTTHYPDDALPSIAELFEPVSQNMCEFGDILLVIEDGYHPQVRLKVNSCILASTSKVFRTLLRGCFAEGEAIRAGTREVYMNDNPRSMLAMCQLLHLKPVEPALDQRDMLELALLVDKFDCVQPLNHATAGLLSNLDLTKSSPILHDLTASAYILDQPTHFRRFTKAVVLQSTDNYAPETELQLQNPTIEHLPALFRVSISHQQNAVRNELVKCLTNILDQFTTTSHQEHRPNLVHQLMTSMKAQSLWPIWPGNSGLKSLEGQLKAFSSLELPIISADRDKFYVPPPPAPSPAPSVIDRQHGGWVAYDSMPPSPRLRSPPIRTKEVPTLRTVLDLSEQLTSLCVGLCLDCSKGNDVCRLPHPDPWTAYRAGLNFHFAQETPHEDVVEAELQAEVIRAGFNNGFRGWGAY